MGSKQAKREVCSYGTIATAECFREIAQEGTHNSAPLFDGNGL